jgi:hypothetical protein
MPKPTNCLTLEDGTDRLSRNVGHYQSNIPEWQRPHLHCGRSQKSSIYVIFHLQLTLPLHIQIYCCISNHIMVTTLNCHKLFSLYFIIYKPKTRTYLIMFLRLPSVSPGNCKETILKIIAITSFQIPPIVECYIII